MQLIEHSYKNIHQVFDEIETVYVMTSEKHCAQSLIKPVFDNCFKHLFSLFSEYGKVDYKCTYSNKPFTRLKLTHEDDKTIIICISGGKDSLATVFHYKELGYKIYLYHLKGINFTYKDEYKAVEQLADKLGLPLIFEGIKLSGKQEWIEHPMKNMLIANGALQYGIRNNITTNIAFGNFSTSSLESDPFDVCGGDCAEMWEAYETIIRRVIPQFKIKTPLTNFQDTINTLLKHSEYLELVQSCIGPYRYREYLKTNNEKKYNIKLLPHRCGSCWKCCLEYCVFCDNDILDFNEAYYWHCLKVLQTTLFKETGIKYNIDETWEHYFFYSQEKSKWFKNNVALDK